MISLTATLAVGQGDADSERVGKQAFRLCRACHSMESTGSSNAGPTLYRLFGRKAGSQAGFDFSEAMKNSTVVWSDQTLDKFLMNPQAVIPGTKMALGSVNDPEQRKVLITYLKEHDGTTP